MQDNPPTASEVIEAVNALRIANGLLPLNPHPVLMQVAQWEANAIAGGAPGHTRPGGLTLGQWLISLGYPLAGDLSLELVIAVSVGFADEKDEIPGIEEPFIKPWMIDLADDHYELDISRARNLLGWEPKNRLIETLPKMIEAFRRDPAQWRSHHGIGIEAKAEAGT